MKRIAAAEHVRFVMQAQQFLLSLAYQRPPTPSIQHIEQGTRGSGACLCNRTGAIPCSVRSIYIVLLYHKLYC